MGLLPSQKLSMNTPLKIKYLTSDLLLLENHILQNTSYYQALNFNKATLLFQSEIQISITGLKLNLLGIYNT